MNEGQEDESKGWTTGWHLPVGCFLSELEGS